MAITKGPPRPDLYHPDREIPEQFRRAPGNNPLRRQELRDQRKARSIAREARQARKKAAPKMRRTRKVQKLRATQKAQEQEIAAKLAAVVKVHN